MASKSEDWELSKENVQPLRHGRQMDSLSHALEDEQKFDNLRQRQSDFELELRVYSGPDPLEVWCRYIPWIEQNFPKGGAEGNLFKIIHKCCVMFTKDPRYINDERFLDIWLKLISMSTDPFALYQFMHVNNLCCNLAKFYVHWALELEEVGEKAKADGIYMEGIQRNALPIDFLQTKHRLFLARMTRTVPESWHTNGNYQVQEEEKTREALNILAQTGKKGHVAFNRVDHVKSDVPNILPFSGHYLQTNSNTHINICHDENASSVFPIRSADEIKLSSISNSSKENERKAGKWTKSKLKLKTTTDDALTPSFTIHQEDCPSSQSISERESNKWNVPLTEKKVEVPSFLPISTERNSKVDVMYCQEKILCGGQEFSFEELRAYRWQQRQKRSTEKNLHNESQDQQQEILKESGKELRDSADFGNEDTDCDNRFHPMENTSLKNNSHSNHDQSVEKEQELADQATLHEKKMELYNADPCVQLISPTIHTKEAFSAMVGFFNTSLNLPSESDGVTTELHDSPRIQTEDPPRIQTEDPPFTIFSDIDVKTNLCSNFETETENNTVDQDSNLPALDNPPEKQMLKSEETTETTENSVVDKPLDEFSTSTCGYSVNDYTDFTVIPPINSNVFAEQAKKFSTPINFHDAMHKSSLTDKDISSPNSSQENNTTVKIAREVDPFNSTLISELLRNVTPTIYQRPGIKKMNCSLPSIKVGSVCSFDSEQYKISSKFTGGFAVLYKAIVHEDNQKQTVALKVQHPPCEWEFYIMSELKERLQALSSTIDVSEGILQLNKAYIFEECSVYASKWIKHGTLLHAINTYKLKKSTMPEMIVLYFAVELMRVLQQMHKCNIIHGDIKPDNILLTNLTELSANATATCPENAFFNKVKTITFIDFGQSIDMTLFPPGTTFTNCVQTEDFICPEMKDKRPWTYQIDYFGLLGTIHCMLFGTYINILKRDNIWTQNSRPKRYWNGELWQEFFNEWLNIPSCDELPDLDNWLKRFQDEFFKLHRQKDVRYLMHNLKLSVVENS